MDIIKIGILGILIVIIALLLKQYKPEFAFIFVICGAVFMMYLCIGAMVTLNEAIISIEAKIGGASQYIKLLIKIVGIAYISEFCSGICIDAGYGTLGKQIEIAGKFSIVLTGLPILFTLFQTMEDYFGC